MWLFVVLLSLFGNICVQVDENLLSKQQKTKKDFFLFAGVTRKRREYDHLYLHAQHKGRASYPSSEDDH